MCGPSKRSWMEVAQDRSLQLWVFGFLSAIYLEGRIFEILNRKSWSLYIYVYWEIFHMWEATCINLMIVRHCKTPNIDRVHVTSGEIKGLIYIIMHNTHSHHSPERRHNDHFTKTSAKSSLYVVLLHQWEHDNACIPGINCILDQQWVDECQA